MVKVQEVTQPGAVPAKTTNTTTINMNKDDECLDCLEIQDEGRGSNRKMTKSRAREIAKELLQHSIAVCYYQLENENYTQEEEELINAELDKLGRRAAKAIGVDYVTY